MTHVTANVNPNIKPLIAVDNDKVCVTIIKSLADSKDVIVRLRSLSDKQETVKLTFPAGMPKAVHICTVEETAGEQINGSVTILPYGMLTLRVKQ